MKKFFAKTCLLALSFTPILESSASKSDEEKSTKSHATEITLVSEQQKKITQQPACSPEKLTHITNKETLGEHQNILRFFTSVSPTLSAMMRDPKKFGCCFTKKPATKISDDPLKYTTSIFCSGCGFGETFIRTFPISESDSCASCPEAQTVTKTIVSTREYPELKMIIWCDGCKLPQVIVNQKRLFTECTQCKGCGFVPISDTNKQEKQ